jgi:SAM-dependent methyltransferase
LHSNIFKIDHEAKTLKRTRISSYLVNHNFLIKLSENQILNKISNFSSKVGVIVELGSNSSIGKLYNKSDNSFFVSIDNSFDFLKQNSSSNNNLVFDENNLPFKQGSISGIISCLYLDSIIESENLFSNIFKILKNDGFLIFSIFGTKTMENVKECFIKIEERKYNGISLRFNPLFDTDLIGNNLKQIGFKNVIVESEIIKVKYNSLFKLMHDLRGMGITNNLLNRSKFFTPKSLFYEVNEFLIKDNKNREFLVPFEIITVTAWKENL